MSVPERYDLFGLLTFGTEIVLIFIESSPDTRKECYGEDSLGDP